MRRFMVLSLIVLMCGVWMSAVSAETRLKMSTTTSTEDSGLLKVLSPPLKRLMASRST